MDSHLSILIRRFDGHKFEKTLKTIATQVYFGVDSKEEFYDELVFRGIANYLWTKYDIDITELKDEDLESMKSYVLDIFKPLIEIYYRNAKKSFPR
jgi:hypothetical protein